MTVRALGVALCLAIACPAIGCRSSPKTMGMDLRTRTRFEAEWKRYQKLEDHRAMAVSGDTEGRYAMGYAFGEPDPESAAAAALTACESRRSDLGLEAPCRLHARGSQVLGE